MARSVEQVLNVRLAELLRTLGLAALPENRQPGSNKQIDIDVDLGVWRVALEAEIDSPAGALADARKRAREAGIGLVVAHSVIAVSYPAGLSAERFTTDTNIEWAVLPSSDFTAGSVWQLAGVVRRTRPTGSDPDHLAAGLDKALALGVEGLSSAQRDDLAGAVDAAWASGTRVAAAAKRALLVVAAAAMFHARLDAHLRQNPPTTDARTGEPYQGPWPPAKLQHCLSGPDPVDDLDAAWDLILAVDYRPIFEAARRVLTEPAQDSVWAESVKNVAQQALSVSRDASSLRHDLMGRIFHRLVDSARYDGSYYTSSAAATLLAGLAVRSGDLPQDLSDYSVIDPACGTGTLLMAAAERIRDLRGPHTTDGDAVTLIEDTICGLDVNVTACHMAATTLGLLSPSTTFKNMNIRLMPLGMDPNGDTRVGSLELLTVKPGDPRLDLGIDWASGEHIDTGDKAEIAANSQRLVIMNPPYTRDSLRHDQFPADVERKLKNREKILTSGRAGHGSSGSTMFLDLGEHLAALDGGSTLAAVLPMAGAGNPAGLAARKLLAAWFHIDWVVASHDSGRLFFSENTSISEMLVVCRRRRGDAERPQPTRFLILRRNPSEPTDAAGLVAALENDALPTSVGMTSRWPADKMAAGQWRPLGLTSEHLVSLFTQVEQGELLPVTRLGDDWHIGPAGQRIREAFTKQDAADAAGGRALWHNDTNATQTMAADPDVYIHPKSAPALKRRADRYWEQRGRLLLPTDPRVQTARVSAVHLRQPVLGSRWVPARPSDGPHARDLEKAVCAWLNSTLGWITMIGVATPNVLARPELSIDAMRRLPIPVLDAETLAALSAAFDGHATAQLRPLREAHTDPQRESLDNAVSSALGFAPGVAAGARNEFAVEPSTQ